MYCQITPSYKNMPWFKLYRNIFKNKSLIKTAKSGITYFILLPVKDKPENIHRAITGVKFSICGIILAKAVTKITKLIKNVFSILFIIINGARGRSRTGTVLLPRDFKSLASTNSATRAHIKWYQWRLRSESNRRTRFCRPLHNHSATQPYS